MPWIHVVLPADSENGRTDAANRIAAATAEALDLDPSDVIVFLTPAAASAGDGAVAYVAGRRRSEEQEAALQSAVRLAVADVVATEQELVAVVRLA